MFWSTVFDVVQIQTRQKSSVAPLFDQKCNRAFGSSGGIYQLDPDLVRTGFRPTVPS
jgi:hypothetical protein